MTSSSVAFPATESPQKPSKPPPSAIRPHLPFRRISLPTAPTLAHRESVFSIASVDSLPEDDEVHPNPRTATPSNLKSSALHSKGGSRTRLISVESPRRRNHRTRESIAKMPDTKLAMKRRRIVDEFYETEKTYVDGLDLIYSHFLTPIISSLESSEPLLNRSALTSIFSNFIDIWNLHRSFLTALMKLLNTNNTASNSQTTSTDNILPKISPLLLAHFPYLSLYTPFITSFPSTISSLIELVSPPTASRPNSSYNPQFAAFLEQQESDPRCGKFKLRDWLLTIVQRCPRYLLLLKDLIENSEKEDPEHAQLTAVHTLVSKITLSLNTSLHTHSQTMALLALQKTTPNLPFQLISPGRTLLKRGSLVQIERSDPPAEREFLLFSDCLIWLAPAESSSSWEWSWSTGTGSGSGVGQSSNNTPTSQASLGSQERPGMIRSRSKSDAELPTLRSSREDEAGGNIGNPSPSTPSTPLKQIRRQSNYHPSPPPPPMAKRLASVDDRWIFKGKLDLVDVEVVLGSSLEDERRVDILSPEGSFAIFAATEKERDEWTSEIRAAKGQLLISLNVTNPNSTLTSSSSTNHIRKVLQALPYHPSDDRIGTLKTSSSVDLLSSATSPLSGRFAKFGGKKEKGKEKEKEKIRKRGQSVERRQKVEHWVPPVWIPDSKTSACMRCGRMFGWRRRRHHCRLCGRCVCSACSSRTFFITDAQLREESKPARACDACYEAVFPLVEPPQETPNSIEENNFTNGQQRPNSDTITSLSHLPSWLSMPTLPVQNQPQALMAIDLNSSQDLLSLADDKGFDGYVGDEKERRMRLRVKSHQRLKSYREIVEDFQEQAAASKAQKLSEASSNDEPGDETALSDEDGDEFDSDVFSSRSQVASPLASPRRPQRREDTARRSKRFSLPAIALQPTNVTARTTEVPADTSYPEDGNAVDLVSPGRNKRFSLVLAGRNSHYLEDGSMVNGSGGVSKHSSEDGGDQGLSKSVAAVKLAELLKRATA
ncbi:hypothetical protein CPB83DRAFT_875756 [Crepidotus variabilis]|uniref:Uncharacterized protein n=1 Tax=Crepidotus variabilis TaxID=179855 RepID=A0A9P6EG25_9AGAR|nr:hypothetical protein CPB83DRAFT_875756 [Crepidotus variabilis]